MSNNTILAITAVLVIFILNSPYPCFVLLVYLTIPTLLARFKKKSIDLEGFPPWWNVVAAIRMMLSSVLILAELTAQNYEANPKIKLASRYTCAIFVFSGFCLSYEHFANKALNDAVRTVAGLLPMVLLEYHMQSYQLTYDEMLVNYPREIFSRRGNPKE